MNEYLQRAAEEIRLLREKCDKLESYRKHQELRAIPAEKRNAGYRALLRMVMLEKPGEKRPRARVPNVWAEKLAKAMDPEEGAEPMSDENKDWLETSRKLNALYQGERMKVEERDARIAALEEALRLLLDAPGVDPVAAAVTYAALRPAAPAPASEPEEEQPGAGPLERTALHAGDSDTPDGFSTVPGSSPAPPASPASVEVNTLETDGPEIGNVKLVGNKIREGNRGPACAPGRAAEEPTPAAAGPEGGDEAIRLIETWEREDAERKARAESAEAGLMSDLSGSGGPLLPDPERKAWGAAARWRARAAAAIRERDAARAERDALSEQHKAIWRIWSEEEPQEHHGDSDVDLVPLLEIRHRRLTDSAAAWKALAMEVEQPFPVQVGRAAMSRIPHDWLARRAALEAAERGEGESDV